MLNQSNLNNKLINLATIILQHKFVWDQHVEINNEDIYFTIYQISFYVLTSTIIKVMCQMGSLFQLQTYLD